MKTTCSFDESLWFIFRIYGSEHNKESLDTLKYNMSVNELLELEEYISIREDQAEAFHKQQLMEAQLSKMKGK